MGRRLPRDNVSSALRTVPALRTGGRHQGRGDCALRVHHPKQRAKHNFSRNWGDGPIIKYAKWIDSQASNGPSGFPSYRAGNKQKVIKRVNLWRKARWKKGHIWIFWRNFPALSYHAFCWTFFWLRRIVDLLVNWVFFIHIFPLVLTKLSNF